MADYYGLKQLIHGPINAAKFHLETRTVHETVIDDQGCELALDTDPAEVAADAQLKAQLLAALTRPQAAQAS